MRALLFLLILLISPAGADVPALFNRNVWVDHNVMQDGRKGMILHCDFGVWGLKDVNCKAVAFFYLNNGQAVQDYNGRFCTADGKVSASTNFVPTYVDCTYHDLRIFMPYEELHLVNPGQWKLKFRVGIWSAATEEYLTYSDWVNFNYNR